MCCDGIRAFRRAANHSILYDYKAHPPNRGSLALLAICVRFGAGWILTLLHWLFILRCRPGQCLYFHFAVRRTLYTYSASWHRSLLCLCRFWNPSLSCSKCRMLSFSVRQFPRPRPSPHLGAAGQTPTPRSCALFFISFHVLGLGAYYFLAYTKSCILASLI